MARIAGKIEFHIAVGEFYGTGGDIDGMDGFRSSAHGVEGEASGIAEHVQYAFAFSVFFEQAAVFALVDKESGFLSFEPIDIEFQAVLQGDEIVGGAVQVTVVRVDGGFEGKGGFRFIVYGGELPAHHFEEGFGYDFTLEVHAYGVELGDGHSGVDVDDQSRQVVAFAVNETVNVVVRVSDKPDSPAQGVGLGNPFFPERAVDFFFFKGEDAYGYGADLIVPGGHVLILRVIDFYKVAFLYVAFDAGYRPGEYPGVVAKKGTVFSRFECYFVHVRFFSVWEGTTLWACFFPVVYKFAKIDIFSVPGRTFAVNNRNILKLEF